MKFLRIVLKYNYFQIFSEIFISFLMGKQKRFDSHRVVIQITDYSMAFDYVRVVRINVIVFNVVNVFYYLNIQSYTLIEELNSRSCRVE